MLGKLFKHDMRAGAKLLLPASLFVLGTTVLGTVALRFLNHGITAFYEGTVASDMFTAAMAMIFAMSIFALCIYAAASFIMVLVHYYRNFFTDEGYLTFTLPVSTSSLITSKLLAAVLWMFIAAIVVIACILIYITFGGASEGELIYTEFYSGFGEAIKLLTENITVDIVFFIIEAVILVIVSVFFMILQAFLAITIGSVVAKKHKILASVGFYYLINMIISTVASIFMSVFFLGSASLMETATYDVITGSSALDSIIHIYMIISIVFSLAIAIAEYLVNRHLLKNRLNLQ